MNYTDTQLKQALAGMLPEVLLWDNGSSPHNTDREPDDAWGLCWDSGNPVLDTELLHLCWLVEETLNSSDHWHYFRQMENEIQMWLIEQDEKVEYGNIYSWAIHATWKQRTIALAKVKGIEIV